MPPLMKWASPLNTLLPVCRSSARQSATRTRDTHKDAAAGHNAQADLREGERYQQARNRRIRHIARTEHAAAQDTRKMGGQEPFQRQSCCCRPPLGPALLLLLLSSSAFSPSPSSSSSSSSFSSTATSATAAEQLFLGILVPPVVVVVVIVVIVVVAVAVVRVVAKLVRSIELRVFLLHRRSVAAIPRMAVALLLLPAGEHGHEPEAAAAAPSSNGGHEADGGLQEEHAAERPSHLPVGIAGVQGGHEPVVRSAKDGASRVDNYKQCLGGRVVGRGRQREHRSCWPVLSALFNGTCRRKARGGWRTDWHDDQPGQDHGEDVQVEPCPVLFESEVVLSGFHWHWCGCGGCGGCGGRGIRHYRGSGRRQGRVVVLVLLLVVFGGRVGMREELIAGMRCRHSRQTEREGSEAPQE